MVENSPCYSILNSTTLLVSIIKYKRWWLGYPDKKLCFTLNLIQTFLNPSYFEYVHYRLLYRIFKNLLQLFSKLFVMYYINKEIGHNRILFLIFVLNILEFSKCTSIVAGACGKSLSNSREKIFQ